ncbi:MAG: 16S rRNA (guanine(966)-N(2))-methyltransferase RsmD [Bacillota bacterium]|nr:16S rRNA (guanine(966)-N(2))-methyltransferase RsmD [Bacillota bacterium]
MRVVAGEAKGHKLISPNGLETRPTTDKVKESLFSMITGHISGALVLDLFAGSGSLGIEALSRGAEKCVFTDMNNEAVRHINTNLDHTKLQGKAEVIKCNALTYLKECDRKFDIILLDPPYHHGLAENALRIINERNILSDDGVISVETDDGELDLQRIGRLECIKDKKYGRISLKIYENAID